MKIGVVAYPAENENLINAALRKAHNRVAQDPEFGNIFEGESLELLLVGDNSLLQELPECDAYIFRMTGDNLGYVLELKSIYPQASYIVLTKKQFNQGSIGLLKSRGIHLVQYGFQGVSTYFESAFETMFEDKIKRN